MLALAGFAEFEIGAAADDVGAMLDEVLDGRDEAEFARLAVDDREIDDAEADLQLRLLEEIVQDDFGLFTALEFEDDAHAVAIALVADFRNAFDLLFVDQGGGVFDEPRFVDLVGNFGDDDLLAIAFLHVFDLCLARMRRLPRPVRKASRIPWRPRMKPPVGKSGPWTNSMILSS